MNAPSRLDETPIVGIGASAGGLEALKSFVKAIPGKTGACYVIVQHLSPDQKSIIDQLLQPESALPVSQIENGEAARPDHVYIVPPGATLNLSDDRFTLTDRPGGRRVFRPIDLFFASLAEVKGRDAYCVVLSGTGTDGSEGLRAVKAGGGFALVQESAGARFPGMPDSAVATGLVDAILPAGQIPRRLHEIIAHRRQMVDEDALRDGIEARLDEITGLLAETSGNDFSRYKPGTLMRRIERRMTLMRLDDVGQFVDVLKDDQTQARLLAQDFLIGVTRFFRDADAFEALREHVVRPLLERDQSNIRVWVPGCSTGEEVYSIAMILLEEMEASGARRALQIFGTDIDTAALVSARYGLFPQAAAEALGEARLGRFFTVEAGQYRAVPELREVCVFAPHNLVQDPPFSRIDLISCRNLLIYLSSELQGRVIPRMHFALRAGGHLFLGPSETVGADDDLFVPVDKVNRLFVKNSDVQTRYSALRDPVPRERVSRPMATALADMQRLAPPHSDTTRELLAEREFLRRFAAPFALITDAGDIVYLSERMTDFVAPSSGVPSSNLDAYLRRELRLPVRNALWQARETGEIVDVEDVVLDDRGTASLVDIRLGPTERDGSLYLVALNRVRTVEDGAVGSALARRETADQDMLETENFNLRRQLAAVLQEFETSGQELKSTNEELLSMNEELQSSNEEIETSREELQSINEELETVNAELQDNNRLLTRANSDLKNLFESTDVAVLFLDRNFCVRNFTPATTSLFGIRPRDIGRPISDLSSRMDYPGLAEDARAVDESLQSLERELRVEATGETFLLRIKPYRTTANVLDGYVLAFIDITNRKNYEETLERNRHDLARQYAELENLYDTTPVGLCLQDRELRFIRINEALAKINGFPVEDHIGKTMDEVFGTPDATIVGNLKRVLETGEAILGLELDADTPGAGTRSYLVDYYPVSDGTEVFAVGACVRDVTEERRLTWELAESEGRIKRLFDSAPVYIATTEGPDHVYTYSNPPHDAIVGHRDLIGKPIIEVLPELEGQGVVERFDRVFESGEPLAVPEFKAVFDRDNDGQLETGWFTQTLEPIRDSNGKTIGTATFAYEITDIVEARERAEASEAQKTLLMGELQHRVKNTLATITAISKLMLKSDDSAEDYQDRLIRRLQAISRTHDVLTQADWTDATFDQVVAAELAPYAASGSERFRRDGPDVTLTSNEALSIGMALHELATNAAKYGALSVPEGTVTVTTALEETKNGVETCVVWHEQGGPAIAAPPDRTGFGSIVLEKVLTRDLGAQVGIDFAPDGLRFEMLFKRGDRS